MAENKFHREQRRREFLGKRNLSTLFAIIYFVMFINAATRYYGTFNETRGLNNMYFLLKDLEEDLDILDSLVLSSEQGSLQVTELNAALAEYALTSNALYSQIVEQGFDVSEGELQGLAMEQANYVSFLAEYLEAQGYGDLPFAGELPTSNAAAFESFMLRLTTIEERVATVLSLTELTISNYQSPNEFRSLLVDRMSELTATRNWLFITMTITLSFAIIFEILRYRAAEQAESIKNELDAEIIIWEDFLAAMRAKENYPQFIERAAFITEQQIAAAQKKLEETQPSEETKAGLPQVGDLLAMSKNTLES